MRASSDSPSREGLDLRSGLLLIAAASFRIGPLRAGQRLVKVRCNSFFELEGPVPTGLSELERSAFSAEVAEEQATSS